MPEPTPDTVDLNLAIVSELLHDAHYPEATTKERQLVAEMFKQRLIEFLKYAAAAKN